MSEPRGPRARTLIAAGEDSTEARERLARERRALAPALWTLDHWRAQGQDERIAQGLPADLDAGVLREAGRRLAPYLT